MRSKLGTDLWHMTTRSLSVSVLSSAKVNVYVCVCEQIR